MSDTLYVIGYVPAADVPAAEAAVAPLLVSPGAVWTVPLSADGSEPATHHGLCSAVAADGPTVAALPNLLAAFPGGNAHTVDVDQYDYQRDWHDWLLAEGLRVVTPDEE